MNIAYATANTSVNAITALANSGYLRIFGGSKPANADTATGETILVQFTLPATAFGSGSNGVATANAISSVSASADGTAAWFRVVASNGTTTLWDGTVTATGGGGDLTISSTTIATGGTVSITSWLVTAPRA